MREGGGNRYTCILDSLAVILFAQLVVPVSMLPAQQPWVVVDDAPARYLDTWVKLAR